MLVFKQVPATISIGLKGLIVTLSRKDIGFVVPEKRNVAMPLYAYGETQWERIPFIAPRNKSSKSQIYTSTFIHRYSHAKSIHTSTAR